jgi:hypothetical protein
MQHSYSLNRRDKLLNFSSTKPQLIQYFSSWIWSYNSRVSRSHSGHFQSCCSVLNLAKFETNVINNPPSLIKILYFFISSIVGVES